MSKIKLYFLIFFAAVVTTAPVSAGPVGDILGGVAAYKYYNHGPHHYNRNYYNRGYRYRNGYRYGNRRYRRPYYGRGYRGRYRSYGGYGNYRYRGYRR